MIKAAPELPAMELTERCYDGMFYGCIALSEDPTAKPMVIEEEDDHTLVIATDGGSMEASLTST